MKVSLEKYVLKKLALNYFYYLALSYFFLKKNINIKI
jgi:hypothetical protein